MIAAHIHDALAQVRRLQELVLEKRLFRGYSGKARLASGVVALLGALALDSGRVPRTPEAHLAGWGIVLAVGAAMNYASLLYWFLFDPEVRRKPAMLKPALDAAPALLVGAVLSLALLAARQFDLLPGTWMCLYGLAQVGYRRSLPRGIFWVGMAYIAVGAGCLTGAAFPFVNPWPMGLTFFAGEWAGGTILIRGRTADVHGVYRRTAEGTDGTGDR